jgi:hypothetical protein
VSQPDFCPTCDESYRRGKFTICTDTFHQCRDCKWFIDKVLNQCMPCELDRLKDVHKRAIDLLTHISRKFEIDLQSLYNEESKKLTSIRILLERLAERRAEVGEWESH